MDNVPLIKPHTYASYALSPYMTNLCFIGCYAYCHYYCTEHQLSCLELTCMIFITLLCIRSATTMMYVIECSHAHIYYF